MSPVEATFFFFFHFSWVLLVSGDSQHHFICSRKAVSPDPVGLWPDRTCPLGAVYPGHQQGLPASPRKVSVCCQSPRWPRTVTRGPGTQWPSASLPPCVPEGRVTGFSPPASVSDPWGWSWLQQHLFVLFVLFCPVESDGKNRAGVSASSSRWFRLWTWHSRKVLVQWWNSPHVGLITYFILNHFSACSQYPCSAYGAHDQLPLFQDPKQPFVEHLHPLVESPQHRGRRFMSLCPCTSVFQIGRSFSCCFHRGLFSMSVSAVLSIGWFGGAWAPVPASECWR